MNTSEGPQYVTECKGGVRLQVKISPGASRTKILGPHGDCLKIAVNAPPEKGKANQALVEMLADSLHISKQQIKILSGLTSSRKSLIVQGVTVKRIEDLVL
jgi:uncharacterized protein